MIISDMIVINLNIYFIVLFIIDYIYIYIYIFCFFLNKIKQKNEKPLVKIWISHEGIIVIKPVPSLTPAYA
jgi:hypothetical protein